MTADELAIRELVATWFPHPKAGDIPTVLNLMSDDVVFLVPGREPFGKEAFAAASEGMKQLRMEGNSEIRELEISGDFAYVRNYIEMTIVPPNGTRVRRAGYAMSILRKESDGRWRLTRDANLLTVVPESRDSGSK